MRNLSKNLTPIILSLCTVLPTSSLTLSAHAAPVPEQSAPTTTAISASALRIYVNPEIDNAELFPDWISKQYPNLDEELLDPGIRQWVLVEIQGETYEYQVTVTAMHDGSSLGPSPSPIVCACNSESLLKLVHEQIEQAVGQLQTAAIPDEPEFIPPEPPPPVPVELPPPQAPVGLLTAGLATGVVGFILTGGGATVLVLEQSSYGGYVSNEPSPAGIAAVAIGLTAVGAAVVMLGADAARHRRSSQTPRGLQPEVDASTGRSSSRRLHASPTVYRRGAGMTLTRRF